jgi:hypothetical protein
MMEGVHPPDYLSTLLDWIDPVTNKPFSLTHRQAIAWEEYTLLALEYPTRADYYAMVIACQVARSNAKDPASVRLSNFRLSIEGGMTRADRDKHVQEIIASRVAAHGGIEAYDVMKFDEQGNLVMVREATKGPVKPPNPMVRPPSDDARRAFHNRIRRTVSDNNGLYGHWRPE